MILQYGDIPVPYPVMWSEEETYFIGQCPWFKKLAICQKQARGKGVPRFGRPHAMRQREAMFRGLCDVCKKPLKRDKISLSNFGGDFPVNYVLSQVEPLLHKECAKLSVKSCPALQRQLAAGKMRARQVFECSPRPTFASEKERNDFVPDYEGPEIIGLAVVDLVKWRDITGEFNAQH